MAATRSSPASPLPEAGSAAMAAPRAAALVGQGGGVWAVQGDWTLQGLAAATGPARGLPPQADATARAHRTVVDGSALTALDSAGAWALRRQLDPLAADTELRAWPAQAASLMHEVLSDRATDRAAAPAENLLARTGRMALAGGGQALEFLAYTGSVALAAAAVLAAPHRWRARDLRRVLHEVEIGGFNALPIVGVTAFLIGVVVAYQGADQLRHYGANIFVVELVGYAMLREFAPLIGAIIIAGRSGSAYAAQIGSMVVGEEIDALRTLGLDPLRRLVLPKLAAMLLALPLLTVFADIAGVYGGMVMARTQLGIGHAEFLDRFGQVVAGSAFLIGVGKSVVFAAIIVLVGCFQGLRAGRDGADADSVGRHTTQAVVQAIFAVIVADALFSVAFNLLGL